jgi:hypothetical protein
MFLVEEGEGEYVTVWFWIDTDACLKEKEGALYSRNAFAIVSLSIFSPLHHSLHAQQSSKSQSFTFSLSRINFFGLSLYLHFPR